jgi:hypothetical protein
VQPKDHRHLQGFAEIVAAVLQSGEACLGRWIPYLSHRDCQARAHMGRLSYFLHNPQITAERYYEPILRHRLHLSCHCNKTFWQCKVEFAKLRIDIYLDLLI